MSDELKKITFKLALKGSRDYLHGTSMYEALQEQFANQNQVLTSIDMVMHSFAHHQCEFVYRTDGEKVLKPENGVAEVSLSESLHGWFVETDIHAETKVKSSEHEITRRCYIREKKCSLTENTYQPSIDNLIAMTKAFHNKHFSVENARWVLGRLQLNRWLNEMDATRLSIELKQTLGARLTKSLIRSNDEELGYIFFTKVAT